MKTRKQRVVSLLLTLGLVGLNLVAFNVLVSGSSTARLDLTSESVFSISPATERILQSLDEDVTVYGYFSKRTHPKLAPLVPEVADLLAEYRAVSGGRLHFEIFDPGDDEEVESEAANRFGVRSRPFGLTSKYESAIVNAYFAIVIKYADQYVRYGFEDLIHVEQAPDGDIDVRLRNLEYDLTRAIKKIVSGARSTHELFGRIESPVKLTAIWTPKTLPEMFAEVPDAVRQAAEELGRTGGDKFVMEEIDPSSSETGEQEVLERFGARPMSVGFFDDQSFYLYALLEVDGRLEQLPLTGGAETAAAVREAIENAVRRQTPGFLKTVGIATSDEPQIPPQLRMQMQMPPAAPPQFEEIKRMLGQEYRVTDVDLSDSRGVPSEVDMLLVLEPKNFGEREVFNLDQYLMRGGRIVICAGNYDADFGAQGLNLTPLQTGLDAWLEHHGVSIAKTLVLDDRNQALPIPEVRNTPFGQLRSWKLAPYPYLVQVREDGFKNPEVTASLDAVGMYWPSPLTVDPQKAGDLELLPLLESSQLSWTDDDLGQAAFVEYEVPAEGVRPQLLAVALTGRFKSYYADREAPQATPTNADGEEAAPAAPPMALERSPETRLVVIGNAEFLSDFVARALGQIDGGFFVENLRFAQNLIDWVSLDNEMLQIRARGLVSRRLERVDKNQEIMIEVLNYVAPVLLLAALGGWLYMRRRQTVPLTRPRTAGTAVRPPSEERV